MLRASSACRGRIWLPGLCLAAGACSSGRGEPPVPDASPAVSCERTSGEAEPFELRLGLRLGEDRPFVELADGDPAPLALGAQGTLMLHLASEAELSLEWDRFCLHCDAVLGPSASTPFDGLSDGGDITFAAVEPGIVRGALTLFMGSGSDRARFEDAEVTLSMTCSREGFSGSAERAIVLRPE